MSRSYSRPEALLVPAHRLLQRAHGVVALVDVLGLDVDAQIHLAARHRRVAVVDAAQVARHQGEQVGRLRERVLPAHEVPAVRPLAGLHRVAVRKQHRERRLLGLDGGGEARHHVGPVEEIGDAPEAFGLALGAVHAAGAVKTLQRGVVLRDDAHLRLEREALRRSEQGERLAVEGVFVLRERAPVNGHRNELQALPVQAQRAGLRPGGRVAAQGQRGPHAGRAGPQVHRQVDGVDEKDRGLVVLQADAAGCRVSGHDRSSG